MDKSPETMLELLAAEICGKALSSEFKNSVSDDILPELHNLSKHHGVSHIVGTALINNGLLRGRTAENFFREDAMFTAFRYENQRFVLEKVCGVLEKSKIPHIPLKGAEISSLYPEEWMRTGCDIDILVPEKDAETAANAISDSLGYKIKGRGKHDIAILSSENVYIELHFTLIEEDYSPDMAKVLKKAWKHAKSVSGGYRYRFDDAMFYCYHVAHMAKHFVGGGCGVRPFIDLRLMNKNNDYHTAEVKALLKEGGLADFAETAEKLSEVWFSEKEHDEVTLIMQEFVVSGGLFGSEETKKLSGSRRSGGKTKFVLSRIFVPYDELKRRYPIIKKYRFLTPICEICRLMSFLFGKKRKFRKKYLSDMKNIAAERVEDINFLFERVGLS